MKFHKLLSVLLSAVLLVSSMGITAAATPETVQDKLGAVEKDTYGTDRRADRPDQQAREGL